MGVGGVGEIFCRRVETLVKKWEGGFKLQGENPFLKISGIFSEKLIGIKKAHLRLSLKAFGEKSWKIFPSGKFPSWPTVVENSQENSHGFQRRHLRKATERINTFPSNLVWNSFSNTGVLLAVVCTLSVLGIHASDSYQDAPGDVLATKPHGRSFSILERLTGHSDAF